jgi:hypothetical protein
MLLRDRKNEKWPKNGRKWPKKSPSKKADKAPISIDYTAHFERKRKWHLTREETKRKIALF